MLNFSYRHLKVAHAAPLRQRGVALEDERDVALDRAALADRVDLLVGARLDVDARDVGAQQPRQVARHPLLDERARVLDVLQREGYIRGYSEEALGKHAGLRIELKYFEGQPAIKHVARVSKPGRRVYSGSKELPIVRNGLGITIVSTPRGVLSDAEAREQNVGGEVLAEVF